MKFIKMFWCWLEWLPNLIFGPVDVEEEGESIESFMRVAAKSAFAFFMCVSLIFFLYIAFVPSSINSSSLAELGTIGDFFGGTLNPTFAFIGLMALLYTLRLNQKELTQATEQMRKAAEAAELQVRQDELQHLLDIQSTKIDGLLEGMFAVKFKKENDAGALKLKTEQVSLISLIAFEKDKYNIDSGYNIDSKRSLQACMYSLITELIQLDKITSLHKSKSNSDVTNRLYATKYNICIKNLYVNKHLVKLEDENCKAYESLLYFAGDGYFRIKNTLLGKKIREMKRVEDDGSHLSGDLKNEKAERVDAL